MSATNSTNGFYGTAATPAIPRNTGSPVRSARSAADEEQPLINGIAGQAREGSKSWTLRLREAAGSDIKRDWTDLVLIFCYIITGLLDSSSTSIWGSFVSMQTGNTIYFGLGLAAPSQGTRWIKSGTSLACFCLGSFFFSRFHRYLSPKKRATLIASFSMQAALCTAAASIVTFGPGVDSSGEDGEISWDVLVPIALVAFQACGQAITSRALKYNALTSVVLTSIYCDLFSDTDLLRLDNPERNRRVGAPCMLLLGAVMGGLLAQSSLGISAALWTASVIKALVVLIWMSWPGEDTIDDDS